MEYRPLFAVLVKDESILKKLPARCLYDNGKYALLFEKEDLSYLFPLWVPKDWIESIHCNLESLCVDRIQSIDPELFDDEGDYDSSELAESYHSLFLWDDKLFDKLVSYWHTYEHICNEVFNITNFRSKDPREHVKEYKQFLHRCLEDKVALFDRRRFCSSLPHIPYDYNWNLIDGIHADEFKKIINEYAKEEQNTVSKKEDTENNESQTDTVCDSDDVTGIFKEESSNKLTTNMEYTTNKKMQLTEAPGTPCSYTYTVSKLVDVEFEEDREWDAKITIGYSIKEIKNSKNKRMHRIYFKLDHVLLDTDEITPVSQMFKTFVIRASDLSGANALQAVYMLCREKLIGLCNSKGFAQYEEFSQVHRKFDAFALETLNAIHSGILADDIADSEHTYVNDNYDE